MIVNPYATAVTDGLRRVVLRALQRRFEVDAVETEARGHATELSRDAARQGYDVVVTFGGDGTVNEAANGLRGSATPLCALPGGSANVFAKLLGIPGEIVDATEHLLAMADDWRPRKVSLGMVNDRCFTFASGLGLDASVVERVDANPRQKARLGPHYFVWVAVTTFLRRYLLRPPRMRVDAGGETFDGRHGDRPERLVVHLLPGPADQDRRRRGARVRRAGRRRAASRGAAVDAADRLARLLAARDRRRSPPGDRPGGSCSELTVTSADERAAAAAGRRRLPRARAAGPLLGAARGAQRRLLSAAPRRARRALAGRAGRDAVGVEHRVGVAQARDRALQPMRVGAPRRRSGS